MYGQDNYNKVKELIDARRVNARVSADRRSEELHLKSRELYDIDQELAGTGLRIFRAVCQCEDVAPIKKRNEELVEKRRGIIKKLGYAEDYTDVKYQCAVCSDTGFVDLKMCNCFKELLITENIKSSGIGNLIEKQSFENFDIEHYASDEQGYEIMKNALSLAKNYAQGFGTRYRGKNLLLMGKTGTGKTHISTAIAKVIISRGYTVVYDSAENIIKDFEDDKFRSGWGSYDNLSDKYIECDLLIIDDLGAEYESKFSVSCLYNLLNTRKNRGLSTIISTNLTSSDICERYDDRICSRIIGSDYNTIMFLGNDYRIFGKRPGKKN